MSRRTSPNTQALKFYISLLPWLKQVMWPSTDSAWEHLKEYHCIHTMWIKEGDNKFGSLAQLIHLICPLFALEKFWVIFGTSFSQTPHQIQKKILQVFPWKYIQHPITSDKQHWFPTVWITVIPYPVCYRPLAGLHSSIQPKVNLFLTLKPDGSFKM